MDYQKIWEQAQKKSEEMEPIGGTLKLQIDEKSIIIDGNGDKNIIRMDDGDADCTIITSQDTLEKLKDKKLNPMMAIMTKKIKIKGNMALAMKLQSLFSS